MKKTVFLATMLCLAGFFTIIPAQDQGKLQNIVKESMKRQEAEKERLSALFAAKQYDSVISYCSSAQTRNALNYDDRELSLATAYWHKGDKTTAYQYVQNAAEYTLRLNGGGGGPFAMLYDYSFGPALPSDTFLEQMIIVKVSDYYKAMEYYPDRSTGLQLTLNHYRSQKLMQRYFYELKNSQSEKEKKELSTRYEEEKDRIDDWLLTLLKENKKIFSRHDIGPANEKQFSMICNFSKPEYFAACLPLLYQAMLDKEINPDEYVRALVAEEQLKDKHKDLSGLKDSLCRVYKCKISIWDSTGRRMISYVTGDTMYLGKDTAYIQDANGGIMEHHRQPPAGSKPTR